jgi:hypothetical protein
MSNFLRKIARKEKKDYKTLYETELQNRKAYETRYKQIKEENIELQKSSGLAELRKINNKLISENYVLTNDNKSLNKLVVSLRIELEDTKEFLKQEKEVSKALRKERTQLRKEIKNGNKND